jgi:hypothetical protein
MGDIPNSNLEQGRIFLFRTDSAGQNPVSVVSNAGTIDYKKGEINIFALNIRETSKTKGGNPVIEISAIPKSNDIIGLQDLYLQLDINNSILNVVSDDISSGSDLSGTTYTRTSSYENGNLIRK